MGRTTRLLGLLLVVAGVVLGALFVVPSGHYLFLPDRARPVDPLVDVPGEGDGAEERGIYMVDILVKKATLLERLFPAIEEGASLVPDEVVNPVGVSETQRRRASLEEMSRSQEIAVTVALRSLGYKVEVTEKGAEVVTVLPDKPADGKLEVGDVIVEARGRKVASRKDLLDIMEDVDPGERVALAVVRGGKRTDVEVGTTADERDKRRAVFGVIIEQAAEFEFPVDVKINAGEIGGPSAGLAFALNVVDELGRDVDGGARIAVTGALELDGRVVGIGGIKQKTFGARQAGADVFVVPDANVREARRYAEDLEIIAVSNFREAVARLRAEASS